jgi:hypothetical protein
MRYLPHPSPPRECFGRLVRSTTFHPPRPTPFFFPANIPQPNRRPLISQFHPPAQCSGDYLIWQLVHASTRWTISGEPAFSRAWAHSGLSLERSCAPQVGKGTGDVGAIRGFYPANRGISVANPCPCEYVQIVRVEGRIRREPAANPCESRRGHSRMRRESAQICANSLHTCANAAKIIRELSRMRRESRTCQMCSAHSDSRTFSNPHRIQHGPRSVRVPPYGAL